MIRELAATLTNLFHSSKRTITFTLFGWKSACLSISAKAHTLQTQDITLNRTSDFPRVDETTANRCSHLCSWHSI